MTFLMDVWASILPFKIDKLFCGVWHPPSSVQARGLLTSGKVRLQVTSITRVIPGGSQKTQNSATTNTRGIFIPGPVSPLPLCADTGVGLGSCGGVYGGKIKHKQESSVAKSLQQVVWVNKSDNPCGSIEQSVCKRGFAVCTHQPLPELYLVADRAEFPFFALTFVLLWFI